MILSLNPFPPAMLQDNNVPYSCSHLSGVATNHATGAPFARGDVVGEGQIVGYSGTSGNARNLPVGERHGHIELLTAGPPAGPSRSLGNRLDPAKIMQGLETQPVDNRSTN